MAKFRKKPVVIEATRWFVNGDHPLDGVGMEAPNSNGDGGVHERMEGLVVRFFRHPDTEGAPRRCGYCNQVWMNHGWVDTREGGHIVCPGDWIITGVKGERHPCKPDIFSATYEEV